MVSSPSKLIMELLGDPVNWDLTADLAHGNIEFIRGPRTDGVDIFLEKALVVEVNRSRDMIQKRTLGINHHQELTLVDVWVDVREFSHEEMASADDDRHTMLAKVESIIKANQTGIAGVDISFPTSVDHIDGGYALHSRIYVALKWQA